MNVSDFFAKLLHAATAAHMLHLQSTCFSEHMALDALYKALPDLVDTLIEMWQAKNGIISRYPGGFMSPTSSIVFIVDLHDFVEENRDMLGTDSALQNKVDELVAEIRSAMYKLKNLS